MKIEPIDLEALKQEQKPWDLEYVANVLCELVSRERGYLENGYILRAKVTPKTPEEIESGG